MKAALWVSQADMFVACKARDLALPAIVTAMRTCKETSRPECGSQAGLGIMRIMQDSIENRNFILSKSFDTIKVDIWLTRGYLYVMTMTLARVSKAKVRSGRISRLLHEL